MDPDYGRLNNLLQISYHRSSQYKYVKCLVLLKNIVFISRLQYHIIFPSSQLKTGRQVKKINIFSRSSLQPNKTKAFLVENTVN